MAVTETSGTAFRKVNSPPSKLKLIAPEPFRGFFFQLGIGQVMAYSEAAPTAARPVVKSINTSLEKASRAMEE